MQVEVPLSADDIKQCRVRLRDGGLLRPGLGALAQGGLAGGLFLMVGGVTLIAPEVFGEAVPLLHRMDVLLVFAGGLLAVLSLLWLRHRDRASVPLVPGSLGQRLRLGISAEGVTLQSAPDAWDLPWTQLKTVEEDEGYVIFRLRSGRAVILPKRAFASAEACRAFVDEAKDSAERSRVAAAS